MFTTIIAWIMAHGGYVGVLVAYNLLMSGVQAIFNQLKIQEPGWLQTLGSVGSTLSSWMSANTPTIQPDMAPPPASTQVLSK